MDCAGFEEVLFPYLDGELDEGPAAEAAGHVEACADCGERFAAEGAFERRVREALLSAVPADEADRTLDRMLESTRPGVARPPARILRFVAPLASLAAGLLLTVSAGWFFCIGPFECGYLQALEAASGCQGLDAASCAAKLKRAVAGLPSLDGVDPGPASKVLIAYPTERSGVRRVYDTLQGELAVVVVDSKGITPSFRRKFPHGGEVWWEAEENGNRIVAFKHPSSEVLYSVVAARETDELIALAEDLRRSLGQ